MWGAQTRHTGLRRQYAQIYSLHISISMLSNPQMHVGKDKIHSLNMFLWFLDNKREHFLSDVKKAVGALPYLNKAMIEHVLQLSKFVPNTNIPTFVGLVQNVYVGQFKLTEAESKSFQKASRHMVEMRDQLIDFMLHKE